MNVYSGTPANFTKSTVNGTPAYTAAKVNRSLVQVDHQSGEYAPVETLTRSIPSAELDANFGLWQDREVTKGHLWWKETVRPADGQVQADEVTSFPDFRKQQGFHTDSLSIGGDCFYKMVSQDLQVSQSSTGPIAVLESEWTISRGGTLAVSRGRTPLAPR